MQIERNISTILSSPGWEVTTNAAVDTTGSDITNTTSSTLPDDGNKSNPDIGFIIGLTLFGIGALLLIIGFMRLLAYYIDTKKTEHIQRRWERHLEHIRHLEEYSIRTGDAPSVIGDNLSLYMGETRSMNGEVQGLKIKVGPFPPPPDEDEGLGRSRMTSAESQDSVFERPMGTPGMTGSLGRPRTPVQYARTGSQTSLHQLRPGTPVHISRSGSQTSLHLSRPGTPVQYVRSISQTVDMNQNHIVVIKT